ncbi:MAG: hypothetical protein GKR89_17285 [Candidatus Latescibacteria bacterium]|nr:hypothetical protein [Candidatus Latescibacterota bacterium]
MRSFPIWALGLILWSFSPVAGTDSAPDSAYATPIAFLQHHDDQARAILAQAPSDSISGAVRLQIKQHINAAFDFDTLSQMALGTHWSQRTEEERAEFVRTFSGIIKEQNFDNFLRYYRESNISYKNEEVDGDQAQVHAQVPLERDLVNIVYLLHRLESGWRVYDLIIDDVSSADGHRKRHARYLQKKSYDELIQTLNKRLARLEQSYN